MNKRSVKWLYDELPELVRKEILPRENAEKIRQYYGPVVEISKRKIALIVFSCFGTVFIGLGVILLVAHNWDELSRPVRTVLSLIPLLAAQCLTGWMLLFRNESIAWREGVSAFLMLSIGISISLISQTYHISGEESDFILTWMVLGIPVIYLVRASLPVIFYLAGITIWSGEVQSVGGQAMLFWPLFAFIIPHYWQALNRNPYSFRSVHLSWGICLCLCVSTGIVLEKALPGLWIIVYASLFAIMYYVGCFRFGNVMFLRSRPFQNVGVVGISVLSLLLSYEWPWEKIGWHNYRSEGWYHGIPAIADYILTVALLSLAVCFLADFVRQKRVAGTYIGLAPVLAVIGFMVAGFEDTTVFPMVLFNVYLFVLAVGTIVMGIRDNRLGTVNAGLFVLSALIVARFFDSSFGFVARGLIFIGIGIGFLTTNLVLASRDKGRQGEST